MKSLQSILFSMLMIIVVTSYAIDNEIQKDILMSKITSALKAGKTVDALPAFAELEGMESSLKKPLPESFDYYYIDTLDKSGNKSKALRRAETYLSKYGKKGKHYGEVIDIMSRLQDQVKKEAEESVQKQRQQVIETERRNQEFEKENEAYLVRSKDCRGYGYYDGLYRIYLSERDNCLHEHDFPAYTDQSVWLATCPSLRQKYNDLDNYIKNKESWCAAKYGKPTPP